MFVLPRITAPDIAQPLGDVRVVRRPVAREDARAGGALAALDRHEVLERDRDAQQRMQGIERGAPLPARRREPRVGGVGLGERPLAVDGQPGVERVVLALGEVEMRLGQVPRR